MTNLRIGFIVMAILNILLNIIVLLFKDDEKKYPYFNAICGWMCAIIYASQL